MAGPDGFVGVFDSGVGGISVLRHMAAELPHERFEFFGDSANAPYGDRPREQIVELTRAAVEAHLARGAKAIVIACNTATSAAAPELRAQHPEVPIVGVEPALKPAALAARGGRVLVMATTATLRLEKFQHLAERWGAGVEVVPVACPGLADLIERGDLDAPEVRALLEGSIGPYRGQVDAVVLGCTHYPFVARQIRGVLGDVPLFDGSEGTARRLRSVLEERGLLAGEGAEGGVTFSSSIDTSEELALYQHLFEAEL